MISACIGSLDEEDLVKYTVAGKQTLERCKPSTLVYFAGNIKGFIYIPRKSHLVDDQCLESYPLPTYKILTSA